MLKTGSETNWQRVDLRHRRKVLSYLNYTHREPRMRKDRLIVGILCVAFAAWTFLSGSDGETTAPATAIAILGLTMIAISRRR